jgi:hypothetical protein
MSDMGLMVEKQKEQVKIAEVFSLPLASESGQLAISDKTGAYLSSIGGSSGPFKQASFAPSKTRFASASRDNGSYLSGLEGRPGQLYRKLRPLNVDPIDLRSAVNILGTPSHPPIPSIFDLTRRLCVPTISLPVDQPPWVAHLIDWYPGVEDRVLVHSRTGDPDFN